MADICAGKQRYDSVEAARTGRSVLIAKGESARRLQTYPCPFAAPGDRHWHVGHKGPAKRRRSGGSRAAKRWKGKR